MVSQISDYQRRIENVMAKRVPRMKLDGKGVAWRLLGSRETKHSFDYAFEVPNGYSVRDLQKQVDAIYAACGAIVEIQDRAGAVVVSVFPHDLPSVIPYQESMLNETNGKSVLLGFDRFMEPVIHSFKIPHMLIAGQSGYGKTDAIRWILFQLISRFTPDQLEVQIIDMKGFSFLPFRKIPHISRIEKSISGAVDILNDAYTTMQERSDIVWSNGDRNITRNFKWRIVLIDEASQISPDLVIKTERSLANIAAQRAAAISCIGREAQVGLIYATQYPTREVIHGQIRANMEAVLCFKTENDVHSNVALGTSGAERITVQGRAIYKNRGEHTTIQVPYVGNDDTWEELLKPLYRKEGEVDYSRTEETDYIGDAFDPTDHLNRPSRASIISWEWFPAEASVRTSQGVRARETH